MAHKPSWRRVKQTGRSNGEGQSRLFPTTMLHSGAWQSLSGPALKFCRDRSALPGVNNGQHTGLGEASLLAR